MRTRRRPILSASSEPLHDDGVDRAVRAGRRRAVDAQRRDRRGGSRRSDGGVHAEQAGGHLDGARGRHRGRRDQPHGRARRLALRHRRPPLLHQGAAGRGPVVRDPRPRRLPAPSSSQPHLLPRQVLRLPDLGDERAAQPRADRSRPLRRLVPLGPRPSAEGQVDARRVRRVPVRLASVSALLQDAEREGMGRPVHGDPGRLGRPADQEPLALPRRVGSPQAQANPAQEGQVEAGDEPDRGVQLSQVRAGDDVGARHGARHCPRHQGRLQLDRQQDPPACATGRPSRSRPRRTASPLGTSART